MRKVDVATLRTTLDGFEEGTKSLRDLLGDLACLDVDIPKFLCARMYQLLSRHNNLMKLLHFLTLAEEDLSMDDARTQLKYSYVSSHILAHGPSHIRVSLVHDNDALDFLLDFFDQVKDEESTERDSQGDDGRLDPRVTINVCSVLYALIDMRPLELLQRIAVKGSFIVNLISHIEHASVAELLVHLLESRETPANDLSSSRVDRAFLTALTILSNERVFELLADQFVKYADDADTNFTASETIDNVTFAFQWLVVKLVREAKYNTSNVAIRHLDILAQPKALGQILEAGIQAGKSDASSRALCGSVRLCEVVLRIHREALDEANEVDECKDANRSAGRLEGLEAVLRNRIAPLLSFLEEVLETEIDMPIPLGLARLEIISYFVACFQAGSNDLMLAMLREGVYSCMFELLFRYKANSLLHQFVVMATDCLLRRGDFSIRKYLFFDFSLVSRLLDIWDEDGKNWKQSDAPAHLSAVIQMSFSVWDCLGVAERTKMYEDIQALISPRTFRRFETFSQDVLEEWMDAEGQGQDGDGTKDSSSTLFNSVGKSFDKFVGTPRFTSVSSKLEDLENLQLR